MRPAQARQRRVDVCVRNGQQGQVLRQLRHASPLTVKKVMIGLLALALAGVLTVGGVRLYRYLVTDRITDGDGMVNEFANAFRDGDTLKSIRWSQSASCYDDCFRFDLEETDGAYTISGWCIDTEGSRERVERIDAPLTSEQWAEVETCLRENWHQPPRALPEGVSVLDGTESYLHITSQREDEILTAEYNGEYEDVLRTLLWELLIGTSEEYAPAEEDQAHRTQPPYQPQE